MAPFPDSWEYDDWSEVTAPRNIRRRWSATYGGIDCAVDEETSITGDEVWFSFIARSADGSRQRDGSYLDRSEEAFDAAFAAARELSGLG